MTSVALLITAVTFAAAGTVAILRSTATHRIGGLVSPQATGAPSSLRLRRFLLGLHAAATVVVLVAAGLFVRTVASGFRGAAGFNVDHTVFLGLQPSSAEFFDPKDDRTGDGAAARKLGAYLQLLDGLRALPGIESVALGSPPIGDSHSPRPGPTTVAWGSVVRQVPLLVTAVPPSTSPRSASGRSTAGGSRRPTSPDRRDRS